MLQSLVGVYMRYEVSGIDKIWMNDPLEECTKKKVDASEFFD